MKIGDKVRNIRTGKIGVVIRIFKSDCITVLESISPTIICTHDNENTLELISHIDVFDETESKWGD